MLYNINIEHKNEEIPLDLTNFKFWHPKSVFFDGAMGECGVAAGLWRIDSQLCRGIGGSVAGILKHAENAGQSCGSREAQGVET